MASIFDFTRNFSFYTIPAAWRFDTKSPRTFIARCEADRSIDNATKRRVIRADAAHSNGFENLGLFAAAVTAGNLAGLDNEMLNYLSAGYLASRIVYIYVYINSDTAQMAMARTGVFTTGVGIIMSLFVMSGNKMRNAITTNLV